jgi:magnesium transporter
MQQHEIEIVGRRLEGLFARGQLESARNLALMLHASDLADLVEALDEDVRVRLLSLLPVERASETLAEMEEGEDRGDLLAALAPERGAELLQELPSDDAADLIAELGPTEQQRILGAMSAEDAGGLIELLEYEEDTAGGLMNNELVAVDASLTAEEAIYEVRRQGREVGVFYVVWVVDGEHRLLGTLNLDRLIMADPMSCIADLVEEPVATVLPSVDQEEVGRLIARYNVVSLPVVDERGFLLGRITFDDVIDVLEAEQTEDILLMAGLGQHGEEALRYTWQQSVRARMPWLLINLGTAALASTVVYVFSETIESVVILAAIMPIIAGLGGNAGTQALAVTARSLALDDAPHDVTALRRHVSREMAVGLINGALLGSIVALLATVLGGDPMLGLVVLLAMWGNLAVAGFLGSFVPSIMDRLGHDPAVSSSMFVTPFTDLCGFLFLLGLGSWLLL